jgi:Domain of unknown function (DUF1929)./Glyoxal oxidase N-terminus.
VYTEVHEDFEPRSYKVMASAAVFKRLLNKSEGIKIFHPTCQVVIHNMSTLRRFARGTAFACLVLLISLTHMGRIEAAPSDTGEWGPLLDWGIKAKHMILMHTGKVLVWNGGSVVGVWDPSTGLVKLTPLFTKNLHCAGQTTLADGRLLVVGGTDSDSAIKNAGINMVALFDPSTNTWTVGAPMHKPRWYPTATALSDGRVLVTSGRDADGKTVVLPPELYNPQTDSWTLLTGANRKETLYPHMFVLPDGRLFEAGSFAQTGFLDINGAGAWRVGPVNSFGSKGYSESAAMYVPGKIIRAGGGVGKPAIAKAAVFDMSSSTWRDVSPMHFPRHHHNLVILADGQVMVVGGSKEGDIEREAVLEGEIWDPTTEQWTIVAPMSEARIYHSSALLLPDGRVVIGGGEKAGKLRAQIFSPPYLFKEPRPTISSSPATIYHNSPFTVGTPAAANISSVALMRPAAVTHAFDQNQRYVPLSFTQLDVGSLLVTAPTNSNIAPPGYYMLIIKNTNGVPSVAAWVHLSGV